MNESLQFIYKEEFWYVSAFINSVNINAEAKSQEIEEIIKIKFKNLEEEDIFRKDLKNDILELIKHISIKCSWVKCLSNFLYKDENSERAFNTVGYFQFEVEHYKQDPSSKNSLNPLLIQQIPFLVLNILKEYNFKPGNEGIHLDVESPIYVFVTSNKTEPKDIVWNPDNIEKYKKVIATWTEIYSGQWEDYSETLLNKRIENNLSNRLSELHFLRRNSGFIYMAEENYEKFFKSYMKQYVIDPTPKLRAVMFALRSINESLDLLFFKIQSRAFQGLKIIEQKISNLRLLRGMIQTTLSAIYNELDYNRRQHYTSVLKHLLAEFEIGNIVERINQKFNSIYDVMEDLYHKKSDENQERTERGLNLLNLLFGAGILADLAGVIVISLDLQKGNLLTTVLNGSIAILIIGILVATIGFYLNNRIQMKKAEIGETVDAVIEDNAGNIILIKRKYPPYQNYYALPGGFIEKGESAIKAILREVKEETNLDVKVLRKIGVYTKEGRDPRGNIQSTAYKCSIIGDITTMRSGDDSKKVELLAKNQLKTLELAFDHKKILEDAMLFY
ncbi:MAG: NUDIX hydrolase [Candidatus Lokiarchaeota archaeon]|nr:NUDIX hydrolase [Candidatus Lokiarchaeota archaeon]